MINILVIDDDTVDRESIKRALQRHQDISVHEAETGMDGLAMLEKQKFDCVFLDYLLPDMDGIGFLRKIYNPDIDLTVSPVVVLTGQGNEAVMADALHWGAQDYLIKDNISPDSLIIAIAKAREIFEAKKGRRQAEEQLRQSQKMEAVGQLTSGIAHDFNNLLMVVLGNARLLHKRIQAEDKELSREDLAKKVQAIEVAANKGAELVRRLMVFTRQRPLKAEVVNINNSIKETAALLGRSLGETIEIKTILGGDVWPVNIDDGQFANALINIAVNARDAMPRGGMITIETHNVMIDEEYVFRRPDMPSGAYVMIAVSDTGAGMPEHVARRIFEPFFTTKPTGEGTGLGLSMVYGLIRQSGGHIHVYSEEGHGTVFRIYIPRIAMEEAQNLAGHGKKNLPRGSETILVVEDDVDVRAVAGSMLEQLGYKIFLAQDARTALEILKHEYKSIDIIFTDIVMPGGMSGADLVRKAQEYYPDIKVLYTSGYTESAIPDYQLIDGEDLIGKPYNKEALAKKIRKVLEQSVETKE